jgi:hypothetical protein
VENILVPFGSEVESQQALISTRIAGPFAGWAGQTVFRLRNGQIWKQAAPGYLYRYSNMPEVVIYSTSTGYRMKVEGVGQTIPVRRIH